MSEKSARRARQWIERGIYRDGDRFGISYAARFDNGAVKRKRVLLDPSVRTVGAARKALRAALADTQRGNLLHKATKAQTFEAFAAEYLNAREPEMLASISRMRGTFAAASNAFGAVAIDKVSAQDVERFKARRLETCAPGSVKRDLAVLSTLFRRAIVYRLRADNPCEHVRVGRYQEKPRRILTADEERRLLAAAAPHLRPLLVLALQTGCRFGELINATWADIDLVGGRLTLRETKSRRAETVPLNTIARETLIALRGPGRVGRVFCFEGKPLSNPKKALAGACRRAGVDGISFHCLRHTAGTRALRSGADIRTVQALLRHRNIETTARYLHSADVAAAAEMLANFSESGPTVAHTTNAQRVEHS